MLLPDGKEVLKMSMKKYFFMKTGFLFTFYLVPFPFRQE